MRKARVRVEKESAGGKFLVKMDDSSKTLKMLQKFFEKMKVYTLVK